jgi:hypothetical protein
MMCNKQAILSWSNRNLVERRTIIVVVESSMMIRSKLFNKIQQFGEQFTKY